MQKFLNNFNTTFIAAVKDVAVTGTPATELDYGVLRLSDGAAGLLTNPTGGDFYVLTAFKKSGTLETNVEVMRVTAVSNATVNECRVTVLRAQEGTTAKAYVSGDYISLRLTAGGTGLFAQTADLTKALVGLGNVDNTADTSKPVSTPQLTALNLKADLANPTFTGGLQVVGAGLFGYGTGAGGTVTQATSKTTAVTLNKPTGRIETHIAALASGGEVQIACNNTAVTANDITVCTINGGGANSTAYDLRTISGNGIIYFQLKNISAVSLSDVVVIHFAVIKGATS